MQKNKSFFKRGQSLLEYGMIIALIIAGIIVGGPILLNAINSHFKLLDNATQDSLTERITSSSTGNIEDCTWTDWTGTGECGVAAGCNFINELYQRSCLPDGETETECRASEKCCTPPIENACGSLLESECLSRMPLNKSISSSIYQGTCGTKATGASTDSFNCLIGEKIVNITCGVLLKNPDDKDDTYVESQSFFACTKEQHDICLPKCSPDPINTETSTNCHFNSTNRDFLEEEVLNRKTTSPLQKPYRHVSRFSPIEAKEDDSVLNGTVKIPYAFVQSNADCNLDRYCEAFCEQIDGGIYLPTSDGTSCAQAACFKTRQSSLDLTNHSFNTGVLPYQAKFTVDLFPYQQATISYLEPDGTEVIYTPDLSIYTEQFEIISNYFSLEITPLIEGEIAPGFSNLVFENECFAYKPSRFLSKDDPLTYACDDNRKVITNPIAYERYCTSFTDASYKGFEPYQTINYSIGCYKPDCSGNKCYFVFCE